jgi:hypothetical protein
MTGSETRGILSNWRVTSRVVSTRNPSLQVMEREGMTSGVVGIDPQGKESEFDQGRALLSGFTYRGLMRAPCL